MEINIQCVCLCVISKTFSIYLVVIIVLWHFSFPIDSVIPMYCSHDAADHISHWIKWELNL